MKEANYKNNKFILISKILFILFAMNIIVGKIVLSVEIKQFSVISDVGEFLMLFAAVICFVFGILADERKDKLMS